MNKSCMQQLNWFGTFLRFIVYLNEGTSQTEFVLQGKTYFEQNILQYKAYQVYTIHMYTYIYRLYGAYYIYCGIN